MVRSRLAVVLFSLVLSLNLKAAYSQFQGRILDLQVVGGGDTKGYIQATVLYRNGATATGPICGTVNLITANFACYSKSLFASNAQGTVDSLGGISRPRTAPVASNLACNSYSRQNGVVTYGCSFSSVATCAPGDSVAVGCNLTGGELAAIIIVCIIVFVVVLVGSILLCIFCCCPRQTVCYHVVAARRAQRSSGTVQLQAHPPTYSGQPRQQPILINPEPPKYEDAVTHSIEPHSSSLPPYKE